MAHDCRYTSVRTASATSSVMSRKELVALVRVSSPLIGRRLEQDLQVHLAVGGVHTRGVVDGIGVAATTPA
jgi:hypothetical protein